MAKNEKVDVVDRRRRRIGLGLCRGAGESRQEGRGARAGAGLASSRTSSARISGDGGSSRRRPVPARRAGTRSATAFRRAGASAEPRCTTSRIFRGLLPNDFKIKSEHGRAHDWPISYQDVAPYYDKVARDIGVSGDAKAEEIWRPAGAPYPMPPMKTFRNGDIWLKGFEAVGIRMVPAAVGMNSTDYKGRPACIYDGWCHVGCPTGALSNPLVTYLADARKAGAEVRPWSTVTRVLTGAKGNRVTGVEYYDRQKQQQFQPASVVVLAAWAAQNPRILLNSANDRHPKGLANSSGLVGKYMMTHFASGTWAMFDENVENHMGTTGAQYMSYDRYGKTSHKAAFGSTFIVCGFRAEDQRSRRLRQRAARPVRRRPARFHEARRARTHPHQRFRRGTAEHREPDRARERQGRIRDAARQDHPQLRPGRCGGLWNANFEEGLQDRQGRGRQGSPGPPAGNIPTIHLMGGTIMGTGAGNSVVNSFGQTHEIANLYVAGPGIFATGGASNPTYTIFALSLRGAEQLAAKWKTIAA